MDWTKKNLDKILEEIHFSKNFSHAHFFIDPLGGHSGKKLQASTTSTKFS